MPLLPGQAAQPAVGAPITRAAALTASPRVAIATDSLQGSIALKGGRIDDLALVKFRETVDPKSPPIVLLSPSGSPEPFYAEFGWTNAAFIELLHSLPPAKIAQVAKAIPPPPAPQ